MRTKDVAYVDLHGTIQEYPDGPRVAQCPHERAAVAQGSWQTAVGNAGLYGRPATAVSFKSAASKSHARRHGERRSERERARGSDIIARRAVAIASDEIDARAKPVVDPVLATHQACLDRDRGAMVGLVAFRKLAGDPVRPPSTEVRSQRAFLVQEVAPSEVEAQARLQSKIEKSGRK